MGVTPIESEEEAPEKKQENKPNDQQDRMDIFCCYPGLFSALHPDKNVTLSNRKNVSLYD